MLQAVAILSSHTIDHLIHAYGYWIVFAFVAIESLGVPFPGETTLIAAALYAGTTHHLAVVPLFLCAAAGAVVGDNIGYGIGYLIGFTLLERYGPKVRLDEAKLKVGKLIFDRFGGPVVFFGRFVSILRTYAAFLAGTTHMRYRSFLFFNAAGGFAWAALYAFGFYYGGAGLKGTTTPLQVAVGAVLGVAAVVLILWLRRAQRRLEAEAEQRYPGPLRLHLKGPARGQARR